MERPGLGVVGNVNINGGLALGGPATSTGIITIVTTTAGPQNQNQNKSQFSNNINNNNNNNNNNIASGQVQQVPQSIQIQPFITVPHSVPQVLTPGPGKPLVRPVSNILKGALQGHRPTLIQPQQTHQVLYHHQQPQQVQFQQIQFQPQPQQPTIVSEEVMDSDSPLANFSREELTNLVFQKYFQRHRVDPVSFRNSDRALEKAFFDFVVNVPIFIDGHKVPRKAWAKAFYETDVIQSAKCLFEALFNQEEMSKCTLNGKNGTEELSAVKMLAIMRASCWMKNKEQDPYSFNPENVLHNVFPSKDEKDKIEKKVFTERRSQANRKIVKAGTKRPHNNNRLSPQDHLDTSSRLSAGDSDSQHSDPSHLDLLDNESIKSEGSLEGNRFPNNLNGNHEVKKEESLELEELYYRYPEEFLDKILPKSSRCDVLIDGILIPARTWEQAFRESEKDTVKAAWTLFQCLFSSDEIMNCTLNGKNGTTELCPVRKLAIIRAVQWMSKNASDPSSRALEFDSDVDSCNLFPLEEDKERIETKVFTERRYQFSRQLSTKYGGNFNNNNNSPNGRPSS